MDTEAPVVGAFVRAALRHLPEDWTFHHRADGRWQALRAGDLLHLLDSCGRALLASGVGPGDLVVQLGPNRPEMFLLDMAAMAIGAVGVVLPDAAPPGQIEELLARLSPRLLFVNGPLHLTRLPSPAPAPVFAWGASGTPSFEAFLARASECPPARLAEREGAVHPDQSAFILFTSGTAGPPHAVVHSHRALIGLAHQMRDEYGLTPGEVVLAFVPLCHLPARLGFLLAISEPYSPWMSPDLGSIAADMAEVHPTFLPGVPRVFEKVQAKLTEVMEGSPPPVAALLKWALSAGRRYHVEGRRGAVDTLRWRIADTLVLRKIRAPMGGEVRRALCGGAPVEPSVLQLFTSLGIEVRETYGMSEVGVITLQSTRDGRPGTVGTAAKGVELRVALDGEIQVRSPWALLGYWEGGQLRRAVGEDGYFPTGDLGELDPDGYLTLRGRRGDVFRTSGGKSIAPGPLEAALCQSRFIAAAVVVGPGRPFPAALLWLDAEAVSTWRQRRQARGEDAGEEALHARTQEEVERAMAPFARHEQVKRFKIVPGAPTIDGGELTSNGKLRRRVILEKYEGEIRGLYQD